MSDHLKIIQQIRQKVLYPVYLLYGEEPYYVDMITDVIAESVLDEHEREFNQMVIYGYDADAQQLLGMVKRYPMMANHLVVIVREAQMMKNIEFLQPYFENPVKSTVLVLCYKYKKPDKRKGFYKSIQKNGLVFESPLIKDYQVPNWIASYVREKGYVIQEKECMLISENLGNDLSKISNELGKVFISLKKGEKITSDVIEQNIGISKDYNLFELQKALGAKDIPKATRIMLNFASNPREHPLPMLISVLYAYFSKILKLHFLPAGNAQSMAAKIGVPPFFFAEYQLAARNYPARKVIRIIGYLRSYDLRSKGVDNISASHGELLKELIFKILH